jgi:hypothetical protein
LNVRLRGAEKTCNVQLGNPQPAFQNQARRINDSGRLRRVGIFPARPRFVSTRGQYLFLLNQNSAGLYASHNQNKKHTWTANGMICPNPQPKKSMRHPRNGLGE